MSPIFFGPSYVLLTRSEVKPRLHRNAYRTDSAPRVIRSVDPVHTPRRDDAVEDHH